MCFKALQKIVVLWPRKHCHCHAGSLFLSYYFKVTHKLIIAYLFLFFASHSYSLNEKP